jgi:t-SNARE complex subunit (syntaxin)
LIDVDNIEQNVTTMAVHTQSAAKELTQANRYQKNARKRACWLMLILCIILTVVLLAVISPLFMLTTGVELKVWDSFFNCWDGVIP